jgi:ribose 5-phosphate isomerase A
MESPARAAAAAAAAELVEPGMTIGLGSGRAVWAVLELLRDRGIRAAAASSRTEQLLREAGIEVVEPDGSLKLALAIDGADEVDPQLGLIKGGGAALLREKLIVCAAERFVVVAEASKRVERLGETRGLPVEVVRFAWGDTRRRLLELVPSAELRMGSAGAPVVTDEGHYLLDVDLPASADVNELAPRLKAEVGVVEHGLFLGLADLVLLGHDDGTVETLE